MKYTATVVQDGQGQIRIWISSHGPQAVSPHKLLLIMRGDDVEELRKSTVAFVNGQSEPDWAASARQLAFDFDQTNGTQSKGPPNTPDDGEPKSRLQKSDGSKTSRFRTVYFFLTKDGKNIKLRFSDRPADDEQRVIDLINGDDARELQERAFKYLAELRRQYGL